MPHDRKMEASDYKKSVKLGANEVQDPAEIIRSKNTKIEENGGLTTIDKTNSNFFYDFYILICSFFS